MLHFRERREHLQFTRGIARAWVGARAHAHALGASAFAFASASGISARAKAFG